MLTIFDVMRLTNLDQKALNLLLRIRKFPLPVKDVEGKIVWHSEEVDAFVKAREAASAPVMAKAK